MRSLYKVLEGILDKNFDLDVPEEVTEIVKLFKTIKFKEYQKYSVKTEYKNELNRREHAVKAFDKVFKLIQGLPGVSLKDYINDNNVTLICVVANQIIVGIPASHNLIQIFTQQVEEGRCVFMHVYDDDFPVNLRHIDLNYDFKWHVLPVESFSMIKAALFK